MANVAGQSFLAQSSLDQTSSAERALQQQALADLLSVLLSAGYFRARVAGLPVFDKVVGGLCWCITSSGIAVDVDIFYDEELSLGAKMCVGTRRRRRRRRPPPPLSPRPFPPPPALLISPTSPPRSQLCENIVKVLRAMGCPSPLQAHQIQGGSAGGDYAAVFPVVRWLVTKVLEYRKVTGDFVRLSSEEAFDRTFAPFAPTAAKGATASAVALAAVQRAVAWGNGGSGSGAAPRAVAAGVEGALRGLVGDAGRAGAAYVADVGAKYAPARRYRRGAPTWKAALVVAGLGGGAGGGGGGARAAERVTSALLEYGERTTVRKVVEVAAAEEEGGAGAGGDKRGGKRGGAGGAGGAESDKKFAAATRAAEEERRKAAMALEERLLRDMAAGAAPAAGVTGANVSSLLSMQSQELRRAAEEYKASEEELKSLALSGDLLANSKAGRAAAHARRVGALQKRVEAGEAAVAEAAAALAASEGEAGGLREALARAERRMERARGELARLDAVVAALPADRAAALKALFHAHVSAAGLKDQEGRFRGQAEAQLGAMEALLGALRADNAGGPVVTRLRELEGVHGELAARAARMRAGLAERSVALQRLARALDELPSRGELAQYERRFQELFDTVAAKVDETRNYFTTYNVVDKKREYLSKESNLVQSILEQFGPALKAPKTATAYIQQMEGLLGGLEEALRKQQAQAAGKAAAVAERNKALQELVDAQRTYYRLVKELGEEAARNEALNAQGR
jgi:hypothetical protein